MFILLQGKTLQSQRRNKQQKGLTAVLSGSATSERKLERSTEALEMFDKVMPLDTTSVRAPTWLIVPLLEAASSPREDSVKLSVDVCGNLCAFF